MESLNDIRLNVLYLVVFCYYYCGLCDFLFHSFPVFLFENNKFYISPRFSSPNIYKGHEEAIKILNYDSPHRAERF